MSKTINLKFSLVLVAGFFVTLLVVTGIGIAEEAAAEMDCFDAQVFRAYNPYNMYLFVLDEREKELGCKTEGI